MHEAAVRQERTLPTTSDPWTQDLLSQRELPYERRTIPFALIDRDASLRNQARINPLNPDTVELYRSAMEEGAEFPAITVSGLGPKYVVLDGNHRMAAAVGAGFSHIDAYVVTGGARSAIELFTFEANTRHGLPTSIEERTRQGMYLVSLGNTVTDVARSLGLSERRFRSDVNVARQRQRLATLKINPDRVSKSLIDRIGAVRNDNVARAIANLEIEANLGAAPLGDLISAVNRLGTEETQLHAVEEMRKRYLPLIRSTAGGRLGLPRNVNRIVMAVRLVDNIETNELESQIKGLDREYRAVIAHDAAVAVQKFVEVLSALKKVNDAS